MSIQAQAIYLDVDASYANLQSTCSQYTETVEEGDMTVVGLAVEACVGLFSMLRSIADPAFLTPDVDQFIA
jgi:hypothetical protein